jgi:hypothetical protein
MRFVLLALVTLGALALHSAAMAKTGLARTPAEGSSASPEASASAGKCSAEAAGPEIRHLTMFSKGIFRCSSSHRGVHVEVILESQEHGNWSTFATAHESLDMKAGKKYVLRTKTYHCSSKPHYTPVRTFVKLVVSKSFKVLGRNHGWTVFGIGPSS